MNKLNSYTDEQLYAELELRISKKLERPWQVLDIEWSPVIKITERIIDDIIERRHDDDDNHYWVWEATFKAIYGEAFFMWRNEITK